MEECRIGSPSPISLCLRGFHVLHFRPGPSRSPARAQLLFSSAAGFAAATYSSFLSRLAEQAHIDIFAHDVRGIGQTMLPVAPAYRRGKGAVGHCLAEDVRDLFWALKEHQGHSPLGQEQAGKPWIFMGHSLGAWLGLYAAVFSHVRRVVLIEPPLLTAPSALRWAVACALGRRDLHPLSLATRKRKRVFRNAQQAAWVFGRLEFFHGWPRSRIEDYIAANYDQAETGLALRHNPLWEADIIESQPASALGALLALPHRARLASKVGVVFGASSPFCAAETKLLVRRMFDKPTLIDIADGGHMVVFQKEAEVVSALTDHILTDTFTNEAPSPEVRPFRAAG